MIIRAIASSVVGLWIAAWLPVSAQRPVFRATGALVFVDVSVKNGNVPVAGLTSSDFDVLDNGVAQHVEAASVEDVPIDVSLVVDLSGSVVPDIGRFKNDVRKIGAMLRPDDRIRLVTFAAVITEVVPMQPASLPLPVDDLKGGGSTMLNDGVLYGLAWPADADRCHLVVVFTDGLDTSSTLDELSLPLVASRTNAVLHVALSNEHEFPMGMGTPLLSGVASRNALIEAARQTGGDVHELGEVMKAFQQVLDDFRHSYVLYYTPQGVAHAGWHDIAVRVTRPGAFTVRARKGYFATD
jgi:hypothetical protein